MTVKIYIPKGDEARRCRRTHWHDLGADRRSLALEIGEKELPSRRLKARIVRTGSRGLYWLEPMVEVMTEEAASPTAR
jgi:formate dehydrogenase iron-sulfur subunit